MDNTTHGESRNDSNDPHPTTDHGVFLHGPNGLEDIEVPNDWENYGDVNPKPHGGNWIQWDRDMWHVVKTMPIDYPQEKKIWVFDYYFEPQDVWNNGNPKDGFTDKFRRSYDGRQYDPTHVTDMSYVKQELAQGMIHIQHGRDTVIDKSDYWDHLESNYGITDE